MWRDRSLAALGGSAAADGSISLYGSGGSPSCDSTANPGHRRHRGDRTASSFAAFSPVLSSSRIVCGGEQCSESFFPPALGPNFTCFVLS